MRAEQGRSGGRRAEDRACASKDDRYEERERRERSGPMDPGLFHHLPPCFGVSGDFAAPSCNAFIRSSITFSKRGNTLRIGSGAESFCERNLSSISWSCLESWMEATFSLSPLSWPFTFGRASAGTSPS